MIKSLSNAVLPDITEMTKQSTLDIVDSLSSKLSEVSQSSKREVTDELCGLVRDGYEVAKAMLIMAKLTQKTRN